MRVEIVTCPRCGKRAFITDGSCLECSTCGLVIVNYRM